MNKKGRYRYNISSLLNCNVIDILINENRNINNGIKVINEKSIFFFVK
jgi:hypothetical protein